MSKHGLKSIIGFFFAGFAGLSFTTAVFPMVMSNMFGLYSMDLLLSVRGYGIPLAVAWAICGVLIGRQGGALNGITILGLCGLISGFILGNFALDGPLPQIGVALGVGLIYGGLGGAILGKALGTVLDEDDSTA